MLILHLLTLYVTLNWLRKVAGEILRSPEKVWGRSGKLPALQRNLRVSAPPLQQRREKDKSPTTWRGGG